MFEGKNVFQILQMGGFTLYIILACSILSLAIILERIWTFRKASRVMRAQFMPRLAEQLRSGRRSEADAFAAASPSPFGRIAQAGLAVADKGEKSVANAMDRRIEEEVRSLERFTGIIGTIGGTSVYIGLFGTVIGIINAFRQISLSVAVGGGMSTVIIGIAEALICTAAGIAVAVPSVVAYNLLLGRIADMRSDFELAASETADLIRETDAQTKA
jgi:biopolymer transport protein ExbB/TolQ